MSKPCPHCPSTAPLHTVRFKSPLWLWQAETGTAWHFVTVPEDLSNEIRFFSSAGNTKKRVGFGSVKVHAQIGDSAWDTSVFPSKQFKGYLLPVKASVRKQNHLAAGNSASVSLHFHQP